MFKEESHMLEPVVEIEQQVTFKQEQLQTLFTVLQKRGYSLSGRRYATARSPTMN